MTKKRRSVVQEAKDSVWHVEMIRGEYAVVKGNVRDNRDFDSYEQALRSAADRNIFDGATLSAEVQQRLIEMGESMLRVRRRSVSVTERYRDHPAFQPENNSEDIFNKMSRIIEYEMRR